MNIKLVEKNAPEYKAGSARAEWFATVRKFNGKPAADFVEAATKKPPVLTKGGKAEPPAGWLRYFVKQGVVELTEESAPDTEVLADVFPAPAKKRSRKK